MLCILFSFVFLSFNAKEREYVNTYQGLKQEEKRERSKKQEVSFGG